MAIGGGPEGEEAMYGRLADGDSRRAPVQYELPQGGAEAEADIHS